MYLDVLVLSFATPAFFLIGQIYRPQGKIIVFLPVTPNRTLEAIVL